MAVTYKVESHCDSTASANSNIQILLLGVARYVLKRVQI